MEPPCLDIVPFAFCIFHFALNMGGESSAELSCLDTGDDPVPAVQLTVQSPSTSTSTSTSTTTNGVTICSRLPRVWVRRMKDGHVRYRSPAVLSPGDLLYTMPIGRDAMHLKEIVRRDFESLVTSDRLRTDQPTEDLILMQSIEGHAHNGAGSFQKARFVDLTIDDVVKLLGRNPTDVRAARQRLIDEIRAFAQKTIAGGRPDRLVNEDGEPFLRCHTLKDLQVDPADVCRGLYIGGKRDNSDVRREAEEKFEIRIGGGEHYFVNQSVMRKMKLDGEKLAHSAHADQIDGYRAKGLVVDEEAYAGGGDGHIRYMYVRHRIGPGQSDDAAIVAAGFLYGRDTALGVFLADAVDTLEKYVPAYSDQDEDIAEMIKAGLPDLGVDWDDVLQFTALSTIPEGREQHVPDSSLRYLLLVDKHSRQSALESHLRAIQRQPVIPMPLGLSRVPSFDFYSYIRRRVDEARPPARPVAAASALKRPLRIQDFVNPDVLTIPPETGVDELIARMAAERRDVAVVLDSSGKVSGIVRSSDLLRAFGL